jgi:hypothetical protein
LGHAVQSSWVADTSDAKGPAEKEVEAVATEHPTGGLAHLVVLQPAWTANLATAPRLHLPERPAAQTPQLALHPSSELVLLLLPSPPAPALLLAQLLTD